MVSFKLPQIKCNLPIILLGLASIFLCSCSLFTGLEARTKIKEGLQQSKNFERAHLDLYGDVPVLHLYGTRSDFGRQYGTILGPSLRALVTYLDALVPGSLKQSIYQRASVLKKNLSPELETELMSLSGAAKVSMDALIAINLTARLGCSTLATWGHCTENGKMIMGRNADYFSFGLPDRGSIIIVFHPDKGHAVAAINFLGMIGAFTGVNDSGVSFGNMLIFNSSGPEFSDQGLTIQLLMREAAFVSNSTEEFSKWLLQTKHAIPMNVMVADKNQAKLLELGIDQSFVRTSDDQIASLAASNHFKTPELCSHPVSCPRFKALDNAGKTKCGDFSLSDMKTALYEARIRNLNVQAAIFEPENKFMHVSINQSPASAGPYIKFDLERLFKDLPQAALSIDQKSIKPTDWENPS